MRRARKRADGTAISLWMAAVAVTCALLPLTGTAGASRADMHVLVSVPRQAAIVASGEPVCLAAPVSASSSDARRDRAVYTIRSTSRNGIELAFHPAEAVRSLAVRIVGTTGYVAIPDLGGAITLRGHPVGETDVEVEFRIALDAGLAAECLQFPVHVEARPL